jgi:hypothetical protein
MSDFETIQTYFKTHKLKIPLYGKLRRVYKIAPPDENSEHNFLGIITKPWVKVQVIICREKRWVHLDQPLELKIIKK